MSTPGDQENERTARAGDSDRGDRLTAQIATIQEEEEEEEETEPPSASGHGEQLIPGSTIGQEEEEEEEPAPQPINDEADDEQFHAQPFANSQRDKPSAPSNITAEEEEEEEESDGSETKTLLGRVIKDIERQAYDWNTPYSAMLLVITLLVISVGIHVFEEWKPIWNLTRDEWDGIF
jgi:hypothetical protein